MGNKLINAMWLELIWFGLELMRRRYQLNKAHKQGTAIECGRGKKNNLHPVEELLLWVYE